MNRTEIFPMNNRPISDYAVFTQAGAAKAPERIAWIGIKCPNPLGVFDTAGNAAEMLLDLFRFSVGSRMHGAAGGFVVKGGSYRKSRSEILPGRREEMPFFLDDGVFLSSDLGFRVVLSGIVTPQTRSRSLRRDWAMFSQQQEKEMVASVRKDDLPDPKRGDKLAAGLARMSDKAAGTEEKRELRSAVEYIKQVNPALARVAAKTIDALIWEALFAEESIVNYTSLQDELEEELLMLKNLRTQPLPEADIEALNRDIPIIGQQIENCRSSVDFWLKTYIAAVKSSQEFDERAIDAQLNLMIPDTGMDESVRLGFSSRLLVFRDHVSQYRSAPGRIKPEVILEDIVETLSP
jgi:hypothetical protein